jgi:PadR family transcriptional regulator AphA
MAPRSSSTREALLGLLTIEPMSGYDLGALVRASIGFFWSESYGQIYPSLKSLAADGLVAAKKERQKGKPDRSIYSITDKGRQRLATWLAIPPQPEIPRNELLLKLFFGAQAEPATLIAYIEEMVATHCELLEKFAHAEREIEKNRHYPSAPYWKMAARFGQLELESHLLWATETLAELRKIDKKKSNPAPLGKEKRHAAK